MRMPAETPRRTIGHKSPAVLSQTMSAQCMARAAANPSAHGSSPNTTALDLRSCSFSQFRIRNLPDATARCLHAKDVHCGNHYTSDRGRRGNRSDTLRRTMAACEQQGTDLLQELCVWLPLTHPCICTDVSLCD